MSTSLPSCDSARPLLLQAATGSVSASERRTLDEHLANCEACAADLVAVERGWIALDGIPAPDVLPARLRAQVLAAVAAAPTRRSGVRSLAALVGAIAAAFATTALIVVPDPDCRSAAAVACCAGVWIGAYALAFSLVFRRRGLASHGFAIRGLVAAAAGLLLVRVCPGESEGVLAIPFMSSIAARAADSHAIAFGFGALLGGVPLALAVLAVRHGRKTVGTSVASSGIYLAALGPALYLASSYLALAGLVALVAGAVIGALLPPLAELLMVWPQRARSA